MDNKWKELYDLAKKATNPKDISDTISVGSVGAAVLSKSGNIFTGICIDTSSSLGMCAERNAISTMFSNGEFEIDRICSVYIDGTIMPPCGACREFMMQTGINAKNIEVLVGEDKVMLLGDLLPEYPY